MNPQKAPDATLSQIKGGQLPDRESPYTTVQLHRLGRGHPLKIMRKKVQSPE
jgi:hypothetical protein